MEDREEVNNQAFMDALSRIDPDLALIKSYLIYTKVNPKIIPIVLDHIKMINDGSKHGSVTIEIIDGRLAFCKGIDNRLVDEESIV